MNEESPLIAVVPDDGEEVAAVVDYESGQGQEQSSFLTTDLITEGENMSEESPLIAVVPDDGEEVAAVVDYESGQGQEQSPGTDTSSDFGQFVIADADELERPWPATFERSISLLAGPTMDTDFIENMTKSPKITPSMNARYRQNDRTPEPSFGVLRPQNSFKQGLTKIQSLDFSPKKRETDAQLYRQKLLAEKNKKKPVTKMGEDLMKKKLQVEQDSSGGHGVDMGGEKATFGQCIFNMANILMGVGMLGLPYIFRAAGWIGGAFVTLSFSAVAYRTSVLLGRELNGDHRSCELFDDSKNSAVRLRKPIKSFPDIARESFGQGGTIILSFVLYFELFSCLCIFFVTLGDHLYTLFPHIPTSRHMINVSFILAIPTALLRTPRLLSYLSAVGTVATIFVVSTVAGSAIYSGDISEAVAEKKGVDVHLSGTHELWDTSGLSIAFGLIAYTFSGHAIIPSIYSSMAKPQDYEKMIRVTFMCVTFSCLIVAISGYYMFGNQVDDQITLTLERNYDSENIIMKSLTWLMILTAFSKFTLTAFPLALGFEEIIAPIIPSDNVMEFVSSLIKLFLIATSLAVAIYVPSFSLLCSLVGLICTMIVSVIFPAAAHLKMFGPVLPLWEKVLDWLFILSGAGMAIIGTTSALK